MQTKLIPYLNFNGNAAEAMKFYQSVFGGGLTVQSFAHAFPETPEEYAERTMHASLETEELCIMASDTHPEHGQPFVVGNNVNLSLIGTDVEKLSQYFEQLATGGKIQMPLEKQFWGDIYGVCEDLFGVCWMINITAPTEV